jgi:hypothetical protein
MGYLIVKNIKLNSLPTPIVLLDSFDEVLYFESKDDAQHYLEVERLQNNQVVTYEIKSVNE